MPGGGAPLPPSLRAGAPGGGPISVPQGNPGTSLAALSKVKSALMLLQEALPALPMGSALHTDVLNTVAKLAKSMPDQAGPGTGDQSQIAALQQLIAKMAQQQPNNALASIAGGGGAGPGAPPVLPPPGPPGAAAGGPPPAMAA